MSTGAQGPATHPRTPKMAVGTPSPPQLLLAITPPKITAEKCLPGCDRVGGGVRRRPPPTSASAAAVPAGQVDAGRDHHLLAASRLLGRSDPGRRVPHPLRALRGGGIVPARAVASPPPRRRRRRGFPRAVVCAPSRIVTDLYSFVLSTYHPRITPRGRSPSRSRTRPRRWRDGR